MIRRCLLVLAVCAVSLIDLARADVVPNPLFSDGAVLQRDTKVPVWGTADDGEAITVTIGSQQHTTTAADGKWRVELDPLEAGGPYTLAISGKNTVEVKDVLVGEVWLCGGQSNMQWTMDVANDEESIKDSTNPNIRLLFVPRRGTDKPQSTADIAWTACDPKHVREFSAVGYYFGRALEKELEVPIGLISSNYGGTPVEAWTSQAGYDALGLDTDLVTADARAKAAELYATSMAHWADKVRLSKTNPDIKVPERPSASQHDHRLPMHLYNGMIEPLVPYAIRGVIWYQGESNVHNFAEYRTRFPNMITDWRTKFGSEMPFLFVQIAPFHKIRTEPGDSGWASLREAQAAALTAVPKTAMVVITDAGAENDIHPKNKRPVGERLALAALALANGRDIEYSGPVYKSMAIKDGKIVLSFAHLGGGLVAKDGPLTGFTIAGADKRFYHAKAEIDGDTVVVSSDQVAEPMAVRFGWDDYPVVNLWNQAGLPASPFRTDDDELPSAKGP